MICITSICVNRKQTASFRIAGLMLAIVPLWVILAAVNTSANAQTSDDVSNSSASVSTISSPADWTQFHRDNMQRWNPYETVLNVNNVGKLQLRWSYAHDKDILDYGSSSPAVANGMIYFGTDNYSNEDNVYALDASTGEKLWSSRTQTGGAVFSPPAVANGLVYVVGGQSIVSALNASTGALVWSYFTEGGGGFSAPAVANGVVYVGTSNLTGGYIYALNASTGALLWSYFIAGYYELSTPAVANGVVYVGSEDFNVYALNASTGAKLWSYATGYTVDSSPAVANGVVYVGSNDGNVYALNASTGAKLWSYATGNTINQGGVYSSPAVANGVVYIGSYSASAPGLADSGTVYALNASTGAKLWSHATGVIFESSPAVANGVVYIGDTGIPGIRNGEVLALNASTGAQLWSYSAPGPVNGSPAVVDGVVYANSGGHVFAFGLGVGADLFLRIRPTPDTVHQGDLITYAFPVWNLGPENAVHEVLTTHVPEGTTLDYVRISGTPGLGTCTTPPYEGTGEIVCHENSAMAPNTTWTVRVIVKVTAPSGTVITENATATEDTPDPNLANNTATVSTTVQ